MKTIGLVGGMSWESSAVYYRDLNLGMQERLGGLSSPRLALTTVDFAEVTHLEDDERWDQIGVLLADAMRTLSAGRWWLALFPGLALLALAHPSIAAAPQFQGTAPIAFLQDLYRRVNTEGHTRAAVTCPSCSHRFAVDVSGGRLGE